MALPLPERTDAAPSVSVIVAVRNGERRLASALASIHAQSRLPTEILVVDGGSTDRTREIARATPGVRLLRQRGRTLADAYNTGVEAARGEFVAFLSHDDEWLPRKLELQLSRLQGPLPADACVGLARFVLEPGDVPPPGFRPELLDGPRPARIMETLLVRRAVLDRVGRFWPTVSPADDLDWFARAQDLGVRVAVVDEVILRKRVHAGSTAHRHPNAVPGMLASLRASVLRKRAATK